MNASVSIPIVVGFSLSLFVNYLADVLPTIRRLDKPVCLKCGQTYNISAYLLFKPCGQCGQRRAARVWLTVVVLIAVSVYVWMKPPSRLGYPISMAVIVYLATVFVIDMERRLILRSTSIFGFVIGLGAGWLNHGIFPTLLGALGGFLIMLALYYLGVLFSRYRARQMEKAGLQPDDEEALGSGDVILAGILGLILGWPFIWFSLLLGILLAGIFGIFVVIFMLVIKKYKENVLMVFMPYGPFLILSAFFIVFLPNWIATIVPK